MCNNHSYADQSEFESLFHNIRRGDIIGVVGVPGRTKAGELTHRAKSVVSLSYCLHQLPKEKSHDKPKKGGKEETKEESKAKHHGDHMLNKDSRYR